jgi:spermidine synthase
LDDYAGGDPTVAGRAYAINVVGCILGPLFASYVLLTQLSERYALILMGLPLFGFYFYRWQTLRPGWRWGTAAAAVALAVYAGAFTQEFTDKVAYFSQKIEVRRDYAATVMSADPRGGKVLLVNGIGMTKLTPITKFMVHLPMAYHQGRPESALIICFGMGTSYRSALSWDVPTTAVELVPDVPKAFPFYHADADAVLKNPNGHIVIDDGRRFLKRTQDKYDIIVIDPPPPVEAAGCSLLYSPQFYALVKQHLKPGGILQAWFPGSDRLTAQAFFRSLSDSFPHVRCFPSMEGWGLHALASMSPIDKLDAGQMLARMPDHAQKDLMEWNQTNTPSGYVSQVVTNEIPIENVLSHAPLIEITDDDPINEYFLLRQWGWF